MDSPAAADHNRTIRSFAQRDDAERARAALADHDIDASIREFRVPDGVTGKLVSRGCALSVSSANAAEAARLLLKMPPSEAPGVPSSPPGGPTRLRRRTGPATRQKGGLFMIGFAILCAAVMMIYATTQLFGPPKRKPAPASTENILIEEDLNGDTIPDVIREFTAAWVPLYHAEDRNFDSMIDLQWTWLNGKPAYREIDLDYDGKFDERTTYDPAGQPFYTDFRPGNTGAVLTRKIFRDGIPWKILEDRDADNHFDHLKEFDDTGTPIREEDLPADSPENNPPKWPPPPAPVSEEAGEMKVKP